MHLNTQETIHSPQTRERILRDIKELQRNKSISKILKKEKIANLKDELKELTFYKYHNQTEYQKRLNKASTYIRFNTNNGYNATVDVIGDAWLQNAIHRAIKDFRFEYEHNNIQAWGGFRF